MCVEKIQTWQASALHVGTSKIQEQEQLPRSARTCPCEVCNQLCRLHFARQLTGLCRPTVPNQASGLGRPQAPGGACGPSQHKRLTGQGLGSMVATSQRWYPRQKRNQTLEYSVPQEKYPFIVKKVP